MTEVYPTDPMLLRSLTEDEWTELLSNLETVRLPLPRAVIRIGVPKRNSGGRGNKIKSEQTEMIIDAIKRGNSLAGIAKNFGVSRQRVHQIKKENC